MEQTGAEDLQSVSNQEEEAAFAASFNEVADPVADAPPTAEESKEEIKPEEKPEAVATPSAPPPAPVISEDQIKLLSAIPELERRLTQQVDRVAGNYGEMKRLLESMQKAAATPQGAAAFDASADGDYIDREFPELANGVAAKIQKAVSQLPAGITTDQFEAMYVERRKREESEKYRELVTVLDKAHPDRIEIRESAPWKQWVDSLPDYQQASLQNSEDPYYVSGMISKFKKHRAEQAALSEKSKKRIESAVTPTGVRPTSPSTISEDEAAQRAFEDQFK